MAQVLFHPTLRVHGATRFEDAPRTARSPFAVALAGAVALVVTVGVADTFVVSSASAPISTYDVSTVG